MSESQTAPIDAAIAAVRRRNRELFPEDEFQNSLAWEKRRSERSGHAFILALLHFDESQWKQRNGRSTKTVTDSVCAVIRETDTAGWYKSGESFGVIFTELRISEGDPQASIDLRLHRALCAAVAGDAAAEGIRISYHLFPDSNGGPGDPILYRETMPGESRAARMVKRGMDIAGSLLALIVLAPLLLLITLAIKLTSPGPALFRQKRVGEGGRVFVFYKFRSMRHNSDNSVHREYVTRMIEGRNVAQRDGKAAEVYKVVNDPRVTPVGRLLRRSSLDELPQFFNVLKGEMSLVGPRPPLPYEVVLYSPWHWRRVLEAKPGITGMWQVYGRSRTNFDETVRLDLRYLRQWSVWLDLKLLLKTPGAVISGEGAY